MSFRRKTNDGDSLGGSNSLAEWGNTNDPESKISKHASPKRSAKRRAVTGLDEIELAEGADKDRYLITYADLITLLLGLFIILYAISKIDNDKYSKIMNAFTNVFGTEQQAAAIKAKVEGAVEMHPTARLKDQLFKMIEDNNYTSSMRLEENERGITVHILEDILFAPGKADLTAGSKKMLSNLAVILRELPNDIRVEGHTDNIPINNAVFKSNWHLSAARATNTAYFLMDQEGLSPDKVSIVGNGEYKPLAGNDTPENRALNRRVDIVIITK